MPKASWNAATVPGGRHTPRISSFNLDYEVRVWIQGVAPSALISALTIFPGLTAGATLCRRFAPGDAICSVRARSESMVHPTWSLEEATVNRPGRKAGVKIDP